MIIYGNNVTIYTNKLIIYIGNFMKKICCICSTPKLLNNFYNRMKSCKDCWNRQRRENYKKSICGYCKIEFRPGIEGRYKFCSEKCRFLNKVKIDETTGCWLWQAGKNDKGYGTFVPIGEKNGLAHRASYRLFNGPLNNNELVLHSCHNPICVAPNHLRIGTQKDNMHDMINANRIVVNKGEHNGSSKLTLKQVKEIKDLYKDGYTYKEIAMIYCIYYGHIGKIIRGEFWKGE
jgi:hypothetical protein